MSGGFGEADSDAVQELPELSVGRITAEKIITTPLYSHPFISYHFFPNTSLNFSFQEFH